MRIRPAIPVDTLATLTVMLVTATSAHAVVCHDRAVQARGEASQFEVIAKAKARGYWRAQVRAMPDLGAAFANWSRAEGADYLCSQDKGGYICTAVGRPCRD